MATNTKQSSSEDYAHNGDKYQRIPTAIIKALDAKKEEE